MLDVSHAVSTTSLMRAVVFNAVFIAASFAWARWGFSSESLDLVDKLETEGGDASEGDAAAAVLSALRSTRETRLGGGVVAAVLASSSSSGGSDESHISLLSAAAEDPRGGGRASRPPVVAAAPESSEVEQDWKPNPEHTEPGINAR